MNTIARLGNGKIDIFITVKKTLLARIQEKNGLISIEMIQADINQQLGEAEHLSKGTVKRAIVNVIAAAKAKN